MLKGMSKRERVLMVVLAVIIVLLGWYKLMYEPIKSNIQNFEDRKSSEENEMLSMIPLVQTKQKMESELEVLRKDGNAQKIPLYDNSKELMVALHRVMATASSYTLDFGEADTDDYIVIHTISLSFNAASYQQARALIDSIGENTFTNQISDVSISMGSGENSETSVSMTVTFFEVTDTQEQADSEYIEDEDLEEEI